MTVSSWMNQAVCRMRVTMNLHVVNVTSLATSLPEAQLFERPTSVQRVMGSIPVVDSDFFLCPTLVTSRIFYLSNLLTCSLMC